MRKAGTSTPVKRATARQATARWTEYVRPRTGYTAVFDPAEEGGYVVWIPALSIATQGEDLDDARSMAEDAIRGYLACLRKHGEEIPIERDDPVIARIAVSLTRV